MFDDNTTLHIGALARMSDVASNNALRREAPGLSEALLFAASGQLRKMANKGEARNSLARAVFIHRLGEIRDRTHENQQHRASGLNLLVTAIILWNTRYLERPVATLRQTEDVPDHLLAHLSPLGWEHVNLLLHGWAFCP